MARHTATKDPALAELEAEIGGLSQASQVWVPRIFAALDELGGSAGPLAVEESVRRSLGRTLKPEQWAHVAKTKAIRWSRNDLRKFGAIGGEKGLWERTELGDRYWRKHSGDPMPSVDFWPSLTADELAFREAPLESAEVTGLKGYFVPVLTVLASGTKSKRELVAAVEEKLRKDLLPGDYRVSAQGHVVYRYRTSWALTTLRLSGDVRNVGRAVWEITDAGRARLEREAASWKIEDFRDSHAMVKVSSGALHGDESPEMDPSSEEDEPSEQAWEVGQWDAARTVLSPAIFTAAAVRLRPDMGPSPERPIARNIILFGPPGTGKTHAAMEVAKALSGEDEPSEDGRWRMVQFHPSYAYEDFVQGLRPDLKRATLRYSPQLGPFAEICSDAGEDPDRFFVLLVDEINRGDPARIFGEALFAIEHRGQPVGLAGGGTLVVPPNLVIVGTMNSVDRSVALLDYALRRRFGFVYVAPDMAVLRGMYRAAPEIDRWITTIERLNEWLRKRLGQEHMVGHSFFMNPAYPLDAPDSLARIWSLDIEPLVAEYLVHDGDALRELSRLWSAWLAELAVK